MQEKTDKKQILNDDSDSTTEYIRYKGKVIKKVDLPKAKKKEQH